MLNVLESKKKEEKKRLSYHYKKMGQPSFYHATVPFSLQIEIRNLDRTESNFLAARSYQKRVIFKKNWVRKFYHPTNDMCTNVYLPKSLFFPPPLVVFQAAIPVCSWSSSHKSSSCWPSLATWSSWFSTSGLRTVPGTPCTPPISSPFSSTCSNSAFLIPCIIHRWVIERNVQNGEPGI